VAAPISHTAQIFADYGSGKGGGIQFQRALVTSRNIPESQHLAKQPTLMPLLLLLLMTGNTYIIAQLLLSPNACMA
jgi:hypothetical protein